MRNVAMSVATLFALAASAAAQQSDKDKAVDASKPGVTEPCEIRAYLLNKERETINVLGITAMLVVEGKDGKDVLIPLHSITTKTGEKNAQQTNRAPRELEGTAYFVSLIKVPSEGSRKSEAGDADRRLGKPSSPESNGKPQAAPADADRTPYTLEGPYFKADLTREQLDALTCRASVHFTIKGSVHTAKGFTCAMSRKDGGIGAACPKLTDECVLLERHIKASEMDKAGVVVDRMTASLSKPCGEAACKQAQHGCSSCCKDLRAAVSSGNREKALEALEAFKAQCPACTSPKSEPKPNGGSK